VRLAREELREQGTADPAPLPGGPNVKLHDLVVRRIEPLGALGRREGVRDGLGPPLAVGAGVAVREGDDLVGLTCDEEEEVVALRMRGEAVLRPLVGECAGAQSRPVDFPELCPKGQRVDELDRQ
jgi:hypothetical protein